MLPGVADLAGREGEVLRLLARGWDNARIAEKLCISEGTVKKHVTSIYAKLHVRSRAEAVAWAWEQGVMGERWS
ncbi:MAG: response regulator transcription factor [Chloroflexota bacterium]|nr:response regulator transcription factor [Chloroflexota bacterium]